MNFLFLLSQSLLFFSYTYTSAPKEFTNIDLGGILLLTLFACAIQSLACYAFNNKKGVKDFLLSIFSLCNIITLNLILNADFRHLPYYLVILYGAVAIFILYTCIKMMSEYSFLAWALPAMMVIVSLYLLGSSILNTRYFSVSANEPGMTAANNIKLVDFQKKPNVYLIAFDALIPKPIFQSLYHTEEATAYHRILDEHFQHFSNLFADDVPTKQSISSLMALDMDYYQSISSLFRYSFFNGTIQSPLFEIFNHNGYETNTVYQSGHFGNHKGPYVDYYHINDKTIGACEFFPDSLKPYIFFGYCTSTVWMIVQKVFGFFPDSSHSSNTEAKVSRIDHLVRSIRQNLNNPRPQIYLAYVYSPGHSPLNYTTYDKEDFEQYKHNYINNSRNTAEVLGTLVQLINNEDPEAILYVFGDHGPWLTRTITFEEDREYFIHDRFAVYGGIFPPGRCAESFSKPYQKNYVTVIQTMYMILRCLTGGEEVFLKQKDFTISNQKTPANASDYGAYVYE